MEFRQLYRQNKALTQPECIRLLCAEKRGVLSVLGEGGYPYGMPMNHYYEPEDGCLYFHCGRQPSHRADALRQNPKASFCVCEAGTPPAKGWALTVCSVVVFGQVEFVEDPAAIAEISARLSRKFTQDEAYIAAEIRNYAHETVLLRLVPEQITGKRVVEA